jgi:hypothetical protein
MNKLQRDVRRSKFAWYTNRATFALLGLLKLVQILMGIDEKQFYTQFPAGWWFVISLGFIFIASLVYGTKKVLDTHPNIQLRSTPDQVLQRVLADPEYAPWHAEAQRLLDVRLNAQSRQ